MERDIAIAVFSVFIAACIPRPIDPEGRPCPCTVGSGWTCDDSSNTCIRAVADADLDEGEDDADEDREPDADPEGDPIEPLPCPWEGSFTLELREHLIHLSSSLIDDTPSFSPDGLTLYFASSLGEGFENDIYKATRTDFETSFGDPTLVEGVNEPGREGSFSVTPNGMESYFTTDRDGGSGGFDVMVAIRNHEWEPFQRPEFLPSPLNSSLDDYDPQLTPDGRTLLLTRPVDGPNQDILAIHRDSTGIPFERPPVVLNVSTDEHTECCPTATQHRQVLLFASSRPFGVGENDLWYAVLDWSTNTYSEAMLVPGDEINTAGIEYHPTIRYDGCEVVFSARGRQGGLGYTDLYRAEYVKLP